MIVDYCLGSRDVQRASDTAQILSETCSVLKTTKFGSKSRQSTFRLIRLDPKSEVGWELGHDDLLISSTIIGYNL